MSIIRFALISTVLLLSWQALALNVSVTPLDEYAFAVISGHFSFSVSSPSQPH
jgi:uncharacterized membrane protein